MREHIVMHRIVSFRSYFLTGYQFILSKSFYFPASSTDLKYNEKDIHITMVPNPSHLEASHPVIMGKARSRFLTKQQGYYNGESENAEDELTKILTIQVHGDAAMAGQVSIFYLKIVLCLIYFIWLSFLLLIPL